MAVKPQDAFFLKILLPPYSYFYRRLFTSQIETVTSITALMLLLLARKQCIARRTK